MEKLKGKKVQVILFGISLLIIFISHLILSNNSFFNQTLSFGIAHPIYWGTRWLPSFFFGLIFVPEKVFISWFRFIRWVVIPFALLIVISPELPDMYTPDRTQVTEFVVPVLVVISLIYIAIRWALFLRKQNTK